MTDAKCRDCGHPVRLHDDEKGCRANDAHPGHDCLCYLTPAEAGQPRDAA